MTLRPITTDYDQLNTEAKEILLHILDNKRITRKSALELLGVGETKIKELLNYLLQKELITRNGQGRNTYYTKLNKENKTVELIT